MLQFRKERYPGRNGYSSAGKGILAVRSQAKPIALFWLGVVCPQECSLCSSLTRAFIALFCSALLREFPHRDRAILLVSSESPYSSAVLWWKSLLLFPAALLAKKVIIQISSKRFVGREESGRVATFTSMEKHSFSLNRYRAYTGFLRGRVIPVWRCSGWELIRFESLSLTNFRD